jgi:hypothetical protein
MSPSQRSAGPSVPIYLFVIGVFAAASAAGVAGWWVGQSSVPLIALQPADCPTPVAGIDPAPGTAEQGNLQLSEALDVSLLSMLQLVAQVDSLEQVIEDFEKQGIEPRAAARGMIQGMSEDDVDLVVGLVTRMSDAELDQIEDIRGYATRLSEIAIDGTFDEEIAPTEVDGTIIFSTEREQYDPQSVAADVFPTDTLHVWAMVPAPEGGVDRITAKFARTDRREIIRLRPHNVTSSGEPYIMFGLGRPNRHGWDPGQYRVTVYTGDEAMKLLAEGTFSVEDLPED